jgi:hypothetical protein
MGLLTGLLTLPLAPLRGVGWTIEQLVRAAEDQYHNPDLIRRELAELDRARRAGRISEAEFDQREDELLDRLDRFGPTTPFGAPHTERQGP